MTSILTNNGAMVALQTLNSINMNLENTQNAISTGKDVATAKDNSAIWAISKVMESDVAGFNAVGDSLALGESTVAVATAGAAGTAGAPGAASALGTSGAASAAGVPGGVPGEAGAARPLAVLEIGSE